MGIKISTFAIVFVLLFANQSTGHAKVAKIQSQTTPKADPVYKGKEVDQTPRIKRKPEPKYTKDARNHGIEGTVVLRVVFTSTGRVTNIEVISGLADGLTDRAIEAAQKISFKPAIKDGHPVSMWVGLEYNFNLH